MSSHRSFPPTTQRILFPTTEKVSVKAIQLTCESQLSPPIAHKQQSAVMTQAGSVYPPLEARPMKNTICLFDVDKTLGPARRVCAFPLTPGTRQNPFTTYSLSNLQRICKESLTIPPKRLPHIPCPLPLSPKESQKSQLAPPSRLPR